MPAASLWSWYCSSVGLGLLCREPTATVIRPLFAMHLVIDQERADRPMDRLCSPCQKVLVITHEKARVEDMSDYFQKKFHPLEVVYLVGRSYKASPQCKPEETLFDAWKDLVRRKLFGLTSSQFACPQHLNDSRGFPEATPQNESRQI